VQTDTGLATVQTRYGSASALELRQVRRPVASDGQVVVRVAAASVNPADWFIVTGKPYVLRLAMGRRVPRVAVRGSDVSGIVESVGAGVTRFTAGDRVFGAADGSFAEYVVTAHSNLELVPESVDLETAAAVPMAACVALQAVRDHAKVQPGQRVLINGAAGGIGTFAVQIAKLYGAEVTAVCSTRNVELMRSIGADQVIDYTVEDFTAGAERYDLILDNVANHSLRALRGVLTPKGVMIPNNGTEGSWLLGSVGRLIRANLMSMFISQRFVTFLSNVTERDLRELAVMLENGTVVPVIDTVYPLVEVATALEHVGAGHARGKVLVTP
jgi:NADPH:quinone reductase-like Zn-dependent oxidoreductase